MKDKKYIIAIDVSLSNTGVAVFSHDGKIKQMFSIDTSAFKERQSKLKHIGKTLLKIRKDFPPQDVVIERGFSRFAGSTQALYMVFGVVNFLFYDIPLSYYHPTTIRKIVCGRGNADKKEVRDFIEKEFPKVRFEDYDQSDAFAVGLCFMKEKQIIK